MKIDLVSLHQALIVGTFTFIFLDLVVRRTITLFDKSYEIKLHNLNESIAPIRLRAIKIGLTGAVDDDDYETLEKAILRFRPVYPDRFRPFVVKLVGRSLTKEDIEALDQDLALVEKSYRKFIHLFLGPVHLAESSIGVYFILGLLLNSLSNLWLLFIAAWAIDLVSSPILAFACLISFFIHVIRTKGKRTFLFVR